MINPIVQTLWFFCTLSNRIG